jgi:hypothetical protein
MSAKQNRRGRRPGRRVSFESLESRTHFDLVPTSVTGVPATLIATVPNSDKVTVELKNTGTEKISGAYTVTLFASTGQSFSGPHTEITSVPETLSSLSAGSSKSISVSLGAFPDVQNGKYYVLAEITGSLAGSGDNVVASTSQVTITDPFIALTDTALLKGTTTVKPGGSGTVAVTVTNTGNITADGSLAVNIDYSTSSNGSAPNFLFTQEIAIDLTAGETKTFDITVPVNEDTPPGGYYIVAILDPDNTFQESNTTTQRTAVTPTPITVEEPYPNILGTFTGSFKVNSGKDKGHTGSVIFQVLTESQTTGEITASINTGDIQSASGTISTSGAINLNLPATGNSAAGTITATYSNNKITGMYAESGADGDMSSFTVTMT